jgi:hypothetical protein
VKIETGRRGDREDEFPKGVSWSPQRAAIKRSPAIAVSGLAGGRPHTRPSASCGGPHLPPAPRGYDDGGLGTRGVRTPPCPRRGGLPTAPYCPNLEGGRRAYGTERGSLRSVPPAITHRAFVTILVTSVTACASNGTPGTPSAPGANANCCPCGGQDNEHLCCECGPYSPSPPQPPQPPQEVTVGGNAGSRPACTDVGPMLSDAGTCPDGYQQVSISCCAPCVGTCPSDSADSGIDVRVESGADASSDAPPDASKDSTVDAGQIDASNATD